MSGNRKRKEISIYFFKKDFFNYLEEELKILERERNSKTYKKGNEIFVEEEMLNELLNMLTFKEISPCDGIGFNRKKGCKVKITLMKDEDDI